MSSAGLSRSAPRRTRYRKKERIAASLRATLADVRPWAISPRNARSAAFVTSAGDWRAPPVRRTNSTS